jgi:hypothetical protein
MTPQIPVRHKKIAAPGISPEAAPFKSSKESAGRIGWQPKSARLCRPLLTVRFVSAHWLARPHALSNLFCWHSASGGRGVSENREKFCNDYFEGWSIARHFRVSASSA